jgi:ketosteroid isomerase-like protein
MTQNGLHVVAAEDELRIRDLVGRYSDAISRGDAVDWASTWADDARWEVGARTVVGRDDIVRLWEQFLPAYEAIIQLPVQGTVRAGPDGIRGRWLVLEILRRTGGVKDGLQVACYVDRYAKEQGEWVFAERRLSAHYKGEVDPGSFVPLPAFPG